MEELEGFSSSPVGVDPTGDFLNNALNQMTNTYNNLSTSNKVQYGDINSLDPFQYQDNYNPELFNPVDSANNYSRYAEMETLGSTLGKSFDDFGHKFKSSFGEYWDSYYRLGKSLLTADMSHLDPTEGELMTGYYNDHLNEMQNKIFMTPDEEDNFFNKQFLKDFLGNAGFTLGTLAAFSLEIAFDLGLEALTGGGASGLLAARAGQFGKALDNFASGFSMSSRSIDDIVAARKTLKLSDHAEVAALGKLNLSKDFSQVMKEHLRAVSINISDINKVSGLQRKFVKTLQELPVLGSSIRTIDKLNKAGDVMTGMQKAGLTFGGFKRSLSEFNLASSEAAFESVHTYGSTLDRLIQDYKDKNGELPSGSELLTIKDYAMNAASSNYNTNSAILLLSNKIQFGNLMSKFSPTKKLMQDFTEDAASRIITTKGKNAAGEMISKLYDQKNLVKAFKNFGDMSRTFGRGIASKQLGKALVRSGLQFEVTEGLQENLQETSAVAWQEYYAGMYNREPKSLLSSVQEGLSDQMSEQGLKTFLIGAFTGSIVRPVTALQEKALEVAQDLRYKKGENPRVLADQQVAKDLLFANQSLQKDFFNENVFNFKVQQNASEGMTAAATQNNIYEYKNHQANALISAVKTHKRLGTLDAYIDNLRTLGESFTEEEFEQAFKIKPSDTKYGNGVNMFNSIADDMDKYSKIYDKVKENLPNILDPNVIDKSNRLRLPQVFYWNLLNDAADVIAFNYIKSEDAVKRINSLTDEILSMPNVGTSSDFITRVLTNSENLVAHMATLKSEVDSLLSLEDKSKDINKQIELKIKELESLAKWSLLIKNIKEEEEVEITLPDGTKSTRKREKIVDWQINISLLNNTEDADLLTKIVNLKNKQSGLSSPLTKTVGTQLLQKVADYINLDRDAKQYLQVVDALANPKEYKKMIANMLDGKFKATLEITLDKIVTDIRNSGLDQAKQKELLDDSLVKELETLYLSEKVGYEAIGRIDEAQKQFYERYKTELNHEPIVKQAEPEAATVAGTDPIVEPSVSQQPPEVVTTEQIREQEAQLPAEVVQTVNTMSVPAKFANLNGSDLVGAILKDSGIKMDDVDEKTGLPYVRFTYPEGVILQVSLTEDMSDKGIVSYDISEERIYPNTKTEAISNQKFTNLNKAMEAYVKALSKNAFDYAIFRQPSLKDKIMNFGQATEEVVEEVKETIPQEPIVSTTGEEPTGGLDISGGTNLNDLLFASSGQEVVNDKDEVVLSADTEKQAQDIVDDLNATKEELQAIEDFIKANPDLVSIEDKMDIAKRYKAGKAKNINNFLKTLKTNLRKEKIVTFTEPIVTEERMTPKDEIVDESVTNEFDVDVKFEPKKNVTQEDINKDLDDLIC